MVVVYDNFLCIVGFCLLIFCWEFLYRYSSEILDCNFPCWWCLCLVLMSVWYWLHRMSLGVLPPSSVFWKSLRRIGIYSFLVEFACEIYGSCTLDCKEFFNYRFYFLYSNLVCSNYLSLTDSILLGHVWVRKYPPGERNGNPLEYSFLGNPRVRGAWRATVHTVIKSQTQLSE